MGNNRFRLSHVMPNTWFYKLRDMGMGMARSGRSTSSAQKRFIRDPPRKIRSPESAIRRSFELAKRGPPLRYVQKPAADFGYGFSGMTQDGGFQSQPRRQKSFRKNSSLVGSPVSAGCSCRTSVVSTKKPKEKDSDEELQSRRGRMKMQMPSKHVLQYGFNNVAGLPSPVNGDEEEEEEGPEKEEFVEVTETVTKRPCQCKDCAENGSSFPSSSASYSPSGVSVSSETENQPSVEEPRKPARRIRTRIGSPRPRSLKPKETQKAATGKKNSQKQSAVLPRGFAVVKRSYDPEKDFKESMIEMILQNDLTSYKDLLRLLECYLSLNSKEYHKTIVEVFQQVWLDLIPFPKA